MSTEREIDLWTRLTANLPPAKGYAIVLIAEDGTEVYGATFSQDVPTQRTIERRLRQMAHDAGGTIRHFEKRAS